MPNSIINPTFMSPDYTFDPNFPGNSIKMGPVTAVCMDSNDNVAVLHRDDRIWDASTFSQDNQYNHKNWGPIKVDTIFVLDRKTGRPLKRWGSNMFYLPHGLTIDRQNNAYVTDVAMHQVFKFNLNVSATIPVVTLGRAFQPGPADDQFCKPTSVAVLPTGDFFVADGYCNTRIFQFTANGVFKRKVRSFK